MITLTLAVMVFMAIIAFAAAWHWMPAGWLTATTGSASALIVALYEATNELMPGLKSALPEEYQPMLVIMFLVLTVAARFRNKAAA